MGYDDRIAAEEARMPNPRRVVRKSLRVCQRIGLTEHDALHVIVQCATYAISRASMHERVSTRWLWAIRAEALNRHEPYEAEDSQVMKDLDIGKGKDA